MEMETEASLLLSLPAELRLHIYSFVLAPTGFVYLSSTRDKRHAVTPQVSPALLRTCRQIHHEAKNILYAENTVNIVIDAHDTCWPTISEARLPQPVLERLEHLSVLLDCTSYFSASYEDVDFLPFVALCELKTLRLRVLRIDRWHGSNAIPRFLELMAEILTRVRADVVVSYGAEERIVDVSDGGFPIASLLEKLSDSTCDPVIEVPTENLLEGMGNFEEVWRGTKWQHVADVWSEYRTEMSAAWRGQDCAI